MDINQEIRQRWETAQDTDLQHLLLELIDQMQSARAAQQAVDLDLEVSIILAANRSIAYGSTTSQARHVLQLFRQVLDENSMKPDVVRHLAAAAASLVITNYIADMQAAEKSLEEILPSIEYSESNDGRDFLLYMLQQLQSILVMDHGFSYWYAEVLSFAITIQALLIESKAVQESDTDFINAVRFDPTIFEDKEAEQYTDWVAGWNDRVEYFRFAYMMAFGKGADEELWTSLVKQITGS